MFKKGVMAVALLTFSPVQAACLDDSAVMGDVGPDSELVCEAMNSQYPDEQGMADFLPLQGP